MIIETELKPFFDWMFSLNIEQGEVGFFWGYLFIFSCLALAGLVLGYLVAAVRHGPMKAGDITYRVVATGVRELFVLSPRRVWALARLAVQEAVRRRVWVAIVVFIVMLLFAGWFLGADSPEPAILYLDFVLTATTYLVLALALFISVFSLPGEFKSRTIYTIVTKPVRSGEIVLGRILGFTIIGTILLAAMGAMSYGFVVRALYHTHDVDELSLEQVRGAGDKVVGREGRTTNDLYHRHQLSINVDGRGETDINNDHWHEVESTEEGGETKYTVSGPRDMFQARVPIYGSLRFRDRTGTEVNRGISVGNEWGYRSYIEGGGQAAAIWTFDDIRAEDFPDGLPVELTIRVFRTYKGNIEKGIPASLYLRNPETGLETERKVFQAKDFDIDEQFFPRTLNDKDGESIDLFDDLVSKTGQIEVWLQCGHKAQYFGMAKADCYIQAASGSFEWNFVKGFASIWVQMVMVIAIGVLFSTFLSGPVAMFATAGSVVLGLFSTFILGVASGDVEGGGPIESLVRLVPQTNVTSPLDDTIATEVVKGLDVVAMFFMSVFVYVFPNFNNHSNVDWVAHGFNIPLDLAVQNFVVCAGYVLGAFIAGYFFLRIREVAK